MKSILLLGLSVGILHSATITYTSLPYRSQLDSPFYGSIQSGTTLLEDFEDNLLDTPGLNLPVGRVSTTGRNSVDEDDGVMDNLGVGFHWQGTGNTLPGQTLFGNEIQFAADGQGRYPTHAGVVLLGFTTVDLGSTRLFLAFDSDGGEILNSFLSAPVPIYSGVSSSISTVGDRFFGLVHEGGISKILVSSTRVDHIQFGYGAIPEPGSATLVFWAGLHLVTWRRRTHPPA